MCGLAWLLHVTGNCSGCPTVQVHSMVPFNGRKRLVCSGKHTELLLAKLSDACGIC